MTQIEKVKSEDPRIIKLENIRDFLDGHKEQIALALPKHMTPDRLLRTVLTTITKTPGLAECSVASLYSSILQVSQLGLEPDNVLGQAYLIPFWNSKKSVKEAQFMIGYKGLIALALRGADIIDIYARVVYENEPFEVIEGTERKLVHRPLPESYMPEIPGQKGRGEKIIAAYAIAVKPNGYVTFELMWTDEINKIRERTKKKNKDKESEAWKTDEAEMCKKTVIKRIGKRLPLSPEFQKAIALDDLADAGKNQKEIFFDDAEVLDIEAEDVGNKTDAKAEALTKKLAGAKTPSLAETDWSSAKGSVPEAPPEEKEGEFIPSPGLLADMITVLTLELKITRPSVLFESFALHEWGKKAAVREETGPEKQMEYLRFLEDCKAGKRGFQWDAKKATYDILDSEGGLFKK